MGCAPSTPDSDPGIDHNHSKPANLVAGLDTKRDNQQHKNGELKSPQKKSGHGVANGRSTNASSTPKQQHLHQNSNSHSSNHHHIHRRGEEEDVEEEELRISVSPMIFIFFFLVVEFLC
jgi:hypothetical protein